MLGGQSQEDTPHASRGCPQDAQPWDRRWLDVTSSRVSVWAGEVDGGDGHTRCDRTQGC